jgi:hypothetical protein
MSRTLTVVLTAVAVAAAALSGPASVAARSAPSAAGASSARPAPGKIKVDALSSGARAWFNGPQASGAAGARAAAARAARIAFGTNVDAADPHEDLAAGQAETAVAATGSTVVSAWNDATGLLVQPSTDQRASLTGRACRRTAAARSAI